MKQTVNEVYDDVNSGKLYAVFMLYIYILSFSNILDDFLLCLKWFYILLSIFIVFIRVV